MDASILFALEKGPKRSSSPPPPSLTPAPTFQLGVVREGSVAPGARVALLQHPHPDLLLHSGVLEQLGVRHLFALPVELLVRGQRQGAHAVLRLQSRQEEIIFLHGGSSRAKGRTFKQAPALFFSCLRPRWTQRVIARGGGVPTTLRLFFS